MNKQVFCVSIQVFDLKLADWARALLLKPRSDALLVVNVDARQSKKLVTLFVVLTADDTVFLS